MMMVWQWKTRPTSSENPQRVKTAMPPPHLTLDNFTIPNEVSIAIITTTAYLIFVIFFTWAKFLENKIYTEKTRKLRQNTQKIVKFCVITAKYTVNCQFFALLRKIHSKLPIFRVKSVKIYTGQKKQLLRSCSIC